MNQTGGMDFLIMLAIISVIFWLICEISDFLERRANRRHREELIRCFKIEREVTPITRSASLERRRNEFDGPR